MVLSDGEWRGMGYNPALRREGLFRHVPSLPVLSSAETDPTNCRASGGWRQPAFWETRCQHTVWFEQEQAVEDGSVTQIWDIFDVLEGLQSALVLWAEELLLGLETRHPGMQLSGLLALLVGQSCLLLLYGRWKRPFGVDRTGRAKLPLWVRPILALGMLRVCGAVPGRLPAGHSRPPSPFAGGPTMREQMAQAEARLIWSAPLLSGGVHPDVVHPDGPPIVNVARLLPVDELEPEEEWPPDEPVPPRAYHISLWICTPMTDPETVEIAVPFPTTMDDLMDAVRDRRNTLAKPWLGFVAPTIPQLHDDYGSFMLLPDWLPSSGRTAVVIDARQAGGGLFALYLNGPLTRHVALRSVDKAPDEPYEVFVGGDLAPLGPDERRHPDNGSLIKVVLRGTVIEWSGLLRDRLDNPALWNPHTPHPSRGRRGLLAFQSPRDQYLHIARRGQDNSPAQVAAWAFGFAEGSFRLRVPTDRPARLNWAGGSVHSVVAVVPRTDGAPEDERVIFIDLRGLGHWPQWTTVEGQYFHPGRYVEALQIDVVDEFSVVVQGGRRHGSDGHILVQDGELIEITLRRTADLTPTRDGDSEGSGPGDTESEGEESDPDPDGQPDSADFSDHPLDGEGPRGPPPGPNLSISRTERGADHRRGDLCLHCRIAPVLTCSSRSD